MLLGVRIQYEGIDTKANPSDGWSREGKDDVQRTDCPGRFVTRVALFTNGRQQAC